MIARMVADHGIDRRRIFVTGLSAGGAMTSVMLATYPEVFAAGAVIAGLPFGVAGNVREALRGMMQSAPRAGRRNSAISVRNASKHKGPWPKVSVWHGSADRTVNPGNADEIVKQWLDVHQFAAGADVGRRWSTAIRARSGGTRMARPSSNPTPSPTWRTARRSASPTTTSAIGTEGAFLIEAGISSSYHIANFFGLTQRVPSQPKPGFPERQTDPAGFAGGSTRAGSRKGAVAADDARAAAP